VEEDFDEVALTVQGSNEAMLLLALRLRVDDGLHPLGSNGAKKSFES
jgi:hypothetical protein